MRETKLQRERDYIRRKIYLYNIFKCIYIIKFDIYCQMLIFDTIYFVMKKRDLERCKCMCIYMQETKLQRERDYIRRKIYIYKEGIIHFLRISILQV